ncbi:MAG: hypothetical protein EBT79_02190 [Actinobacteria bacterium]|nr:hypothetical protein [Actinomycetota bacterium]NBR66084.1 hypothetical protein [Actinomycetota bacterium]
MTRIARTDTLDPALLARFRRDTLLLAKAAEGVSTIEDVQKVTSAIKQWRDQFDTFTATLRQDLEARLRDADRPYDSAYNPNPPDKGDAQAYLERALAPMWEFGYELNGAPRRDLQLTDSRGNPWKPPEQAFEETVNFYLDRGYAATREDAIREAQRYHDRYPLSTRAEAEAATVAKWKVDAAKWARRLREKARKAWDTLGRYAEWLNSWRGGQRPLEVVTPDEEIVSLAGFRVVFRGFAESPYKEKLAAVRAGLERYRKGAAARAPVVLKHTPPIFIEWTFEPTTGGDVAGYYAYNGRVNITPWVIGDDIDRFVKTLAHEVGHHIVHTVLSKDAFSAWSQFVRGDYRDLNLREALAVMDRIGASDVFDKSLMADDPILHLQLSTLMHDPSYRKDDFLFADRIREYLEHGGNPVVRVPVHPITGYAGKNAEEAFCEAVGNLVAYGTKAVPDVVLGMLRSVLGDGVRIASASRVAWAGGACNPNAMSTAWITPDGDVIPVPPGQTHSEWANRHLDDDDAFMAQGYGPARYLTDTLGWVRLVNAYTVETGPRGASDRAMQAVVGILVDCVLARRDIDPESDTMTLGIGSNTRRPTVADFVAEFGTRQQSDALYGGLLTRQWGRTAATRPRYKDKKEVPKADGSGTTTVYVYGPRQVMNRHKDKAERIEGLRKSIGDLRKRVKADLKSDDVETRLTALGVALIDHTFERVGNPSSAEDGHFGVTGWLVKHLTFGKGGATIRYTGKSGVKHEKTVNDPLLLKALKKAVKGKQGDDALCGGVTPSMVNDYLREFGITAKDLRGLHANREMQERLRALRREGPDLPRPRKERDAILKGEFKEALEATAEAVGHEPSTLKNQYLVPWLEDAYMKDGTVLDRLDKKAATATELYFAYGSNLDPVAFSHRIPDSVPVGRAVLPGYRTRFVDIPDGTPGAKENVEPSDGSEVQGFLYRVPTHGFDHLDEYEGVPSGHYRRVKVDVRCDDGRMAEAHTYISNYHHRGNPSHDYAAHIERGESHWDVAPRTATKTEAEREDDEAERLVRKSPKLKPSRDDSKRERMRVSDPDTGGRDRDLSLNYKDNG